MKMRRNERQVTSMEELAAILDDCPVVRLGSQDAEGMFIVPVTFGYKLEDGALTLYFHSAEEGRKAAAFRANPSVSFEMDCDFVLKPMESACAFSCAYRSIMGTGTIRELDDREEKRTALNYLMDHLSGKADWEMSDSAVDHVSVFAVTADSWTGKANRM